MMKVCKICSEEFEALRSNARFCSKDHVRPCKNCRSDFVVKKVVSPPEFCSMACSAKWRNVNGSHEKACKFCGDSFTASNANAKFCGKEHKRACSNCGNDFTLNLSKPKEFCSWKCSKTGKSYRKDCARCQQPFTTVNSKAIYCNGPHYSSCEYCSGEIIEKIAKRTTRFCSTSCASKHMMANRTYLINCSLCSTQFSSSMPSAKVCSAKHHAKCTSCEKTFEVKNKYRVPDSCSPTCAATLIDYNLRLTKTEVTLLERYGVTNSYQIPEVIDRQRAGAGRRVSKLNHSWKAELEAKLGISFSLEELFGGNNYADLAHGSLLIDINPTVSHNSNINFLHKVGICKSKTCSHSPKGTDDHYLRFLEAEESGRTLLQYFDWYDKSIFQSIVRSKLNLDKVRIGAKKTELRVITQKEANAFFRENHLLGATRGQTYCLGLFHGGAMVHCQTYGPARFNKSYQWEALRSATKVDHQIMGGFSKCDKYFFDHVKPESVVSYVDLTISTGSTELMFPGWKLLSTNRPSGMWVYMGALEDRGSKPAFVRDLSAQRLSADRLLGIVLGEKYPTHHEDGTKFTNGDVLIAEGYVQVFDAGTRTFGWRAP